MGSQGALVSVVSGMCLKNGVILLTDFGESNELAPSLASLIDKVDGFLNTTLEVEPDRFGGDSSSFVLGDGHFR